MLFLFFKVFVKKCSLQKLHSISVMTILQMFKLLLFTLCAQERIQLSVRKGFMCRYEKAMGSGIFGHRQHYIIIEGCERVYIYMFL